MERVSATACRRRPRHPWLAAALLLDDIGDTAALRPRELEEIARDVRDDEPHRFATLDYWDRLNASYALARLLVLGGGAGVDPRRLMPPVSRIGQRATAWLAAADRNGIAPGTPIEASVSAADQRMYTHKHRSET